MKISRHFCHSELAEKASCGSLRAVLEKKKKKKAVLAIGKERIFFKKVGKVEREKEGKKEKEKERGRERGKGKKEEWERGKKFFKVKKEGLWEI